MDTQSLTVAVATDLHYLSSELWDNGEAFRLMTGFSDGAVTKYGDAVFEAFVSEMRELRPDAVLICGDLTFNGEKKSHEFLAAGFESLWKAHIPIVLIPGNHDLENPMAGSYFGDEAKPVESVSREGFRSIYTTPSSHMERFRFPDRSSMSFVYALADDLWLMCVDVNGNSKPCVLTDDVLAWAGSVLKKAASKNIRVIGVTHQDILRHNGLFYEASVMEGAGRLLDLYVKYGVHLNLSGHLHIQHVKEVNKVTEIVTSSMMIPPCQYGVLTVTGDLAEYHSRIIDVASWAEKAQKTDRNLLEFPSFSSSYYQNVHRKLVDYELDQPGISEAEKEELALSMGMIDQAFFSGDLINLKERDKIRKFWKEKLPDNFWNEYMDAIFDEGIKDERNVRVYLR